MPRKEIVEGTIKPSLIPSVLTNTEIDITEVLAENSEGGSFSMKDLSRIQLGAGGTPGFKTRGEDGKPVVIETFTGVIVGAQNFKSFWSVPYGEGESNQPPDCASADTRYGHGNPRKMQGVDYSKLKDTPNGFLCLSCPNNQFGSSRKGAGKACRDLKMLLVLTGKSFLPQLIIVPPTSLTPVKNHFNNCSQRATPYYGVVTRFSTEVISASKGTPDYTKLILSVEDELPKEITQAAKSYKMSVQNLVGLNLQPANLLESHAEDSEDLNKYERNESR